MLILIAICFILITIGTLYAAYLAIHSTLIIHRDERLYYKRKNEILDKIKEITIQLNDGANDNKETIALLEQLAERLKTY